MYNVGILLHKTRPRNSSDRRVLFLLSSFVAIPMLASCGQSDLYSEFSLAASKQAALKSLQLDLWARSPVIDGSDPTLSAEDDLERVPRTPLTFEDILNVNTPIESDSLKVVDSSVNKHAPSFFSWAARRVPHDNTDFQVLMSYYHVTAAIKYGRGLLSNLGVSSSAMELPLDVYAAEPGDAFSTSYLPESNRIEFYKNNYSGEPAYDPGDEADAIYHEFGHFMQKTINPPLLELPVGRNHDLDTLLEGLADAYSSAMLRDDNILGYLATNSHLILGANDRLAGKKGLLRSPRNTLSFPSAYVNNINQDARVITGALNDLRRYVSGESVQLLNCPDAGCVIQASATLPSGQAYDKVVALAYASIGQDSFNTQTQGSVRHFVQNLYNKCADWCDKQALARILSGRGLLDDGGKYAAAPSSVPSPLPSFASFFPNGVKASADTIQADGTVVPSGDPVAYSSVTGFMPFPNDNGFANSDAQLDPCELVLIYPNLRNNTLGTKYQSSFWHIEVELTAVSGFDPVMINGQPADVLGASNGEYPEKDLGWLNPGESVMNLINPADSRWYQDQAGSVFSKRLGTYSYPVSVGFMVHAPENPNVTASADFKVSFVPYDSDQYEHFGFSTSFHTEIKSSSNVNTPFCSRKPK